MRYFYLLILLCLIHHGWKLLRCWSYLRIVFRFLNHSCFILFSMFGFLFLFYCTALGILSTHCIRLLWKSCLLSLLFLFSFLLDDYESFVAMFFWWNLSRSCYGHDYEDLLKRPLFIYIRYHSQHPINSYLHSHYYYYYNS